MLAGKIFVAEGVILGRPKGRKSAPEKSMLYSKRELIVALFRERQSYRKVAKIVKVDRATLYRYVKEQLPEARQAFEEVQEAKRKEREWKP